MRAVVQRVSKASVSIEGQIVGAIDSGLVILLGVGEEDAFEDIQYVVDKIINMRIFPDQEGKMNLSIKDIEASILVVSQFTLYGDCRRGRRPSFSNAANAQKGKEYYQHFVDLLKEENIKTATGEFQAMMEVQIYNDGPVTILVDSKKQF